MTNIYKFKRKISIHRLVFWGTFFMLLFRLLFFVEQHTVNVLFWDQWDFLFPISKSDTDLIKLFTLQHGPHRQGLGGVIQGIIYPLSDWDVRVEVYISVIIILFSCLFAIETKRRLFGKIYWTDIIIPLLYFSLVPYASYIVTPNLAHGALPIFFVTLTAFSLTIRSELIKSVLLIIITFLSIFTGFALFSGISVFLVITIFLIKSKNSKQIIINISILISIIVLFILFFIDYRHAPAVDCFQFPHSKPLEYIEFSALQFGRAFQISAIPDLPYIKQIKTIVVTILFFILIAISLYYYISSFKTKKVDIDIIIFYFSIFTILFTMFTAIGRVCLGVRASLAPRYVLYAIPGILAMYFAILNSQNIKAKISRISKFILYVFVILIISKEIATYVQVSSWEKYSNGKTIWVRSYNKTRDIHLSDSLANFKVYPNIKTTSERIKYLENNNLSFFNNDK
jgi:hypothetical protein